MLDAPSLCTLPTFAEHGRETFDLVLQNSRRFAREVLFPTYKPVSYTHLTLPTSDLV